MFRDLDSISSSLRTLDLSPVSQPSVPVSVTTSALNRSSVNASIAQRQATLSPSAAVSHSSARASAAESTVTTSVERQTTTSTSARESSMAPPTTDKQSKDYLKRVKQANKLRSKEECLQELICHLSSQWTTEYPLLVEELSQKTAIKDASYARDHQITFSLSSDRIWNDDDQEWQPTTHRIQELDHVLILLKADRLAELVSEQACLAFCETLKSKYPLKQCVILIQDLQDYYKRHLRQEQRVEQQKFKQAIGMQKLRSKTTKPVLPGKEEIESMLLEIQFRYDTIKILDCKSSLLNRWILAFCEQIASEEELSKREQGHLKVKSGTDKQDTFEKMLMEIPSVTLGKAKAISHTYENMGQLYQRLKAGDSLQGLQYNGQSIGQEVARKITQILLSPAPDQDVLL
ncbi:hypothetical protein EDD86DRAFT_213779 [Gorgonomyces haynaldii]|nr:hypothetical protein EDD86DRAFT_213779 [Gorgonomyces haynaldii]